MRILSLMRQHGITQEMLARELGVTKQAVNIILKGDNPKLATLERIAIVIGVPLYELFVNPEELSVAEGPHIGVHCPHCGEELDVTVPVRCAAKKL